VRGIDGIICLNSIQRNLIVDQGRSRAENTYLVLDKVDDQFFLPNGERKRDFILAVGNERRDYHTLIEAVRELKMKLVIVGGSPWVRNRQLPVDTGERVTVLKWISYLQLRCLYQEAALVVAPLHPTLQAAGSNGLLEALSSGNRVIVTRSPGLQDYVELNPRAQLVAEPHDSSHLADKMRDALQQPPRNRLAREVVEGSLSMDRYIHTIAGIVCARPAT
jgi:glycosyltransferase involved in cell wall biosynthesis